MDGSPGKWHTIPAKTLAELLWLAAKLLQLLFILKLRKNKLTRRDYRRAWLGYKYLFPTSNALTWTNWAQPKNQIHYCPWKLHLPYLRSVWLFHHHIGLSTFSNVTLLQYFFQLWRKHKPYMITIQSITSCLRYFYCCCYHSLKKKDL